MLTASELQSIRANLDSDRNARTVIMSNTDTFAQAAFAFAKGARDHRLSRYLTVNTHERGAPSALPVTYRLLHELAAHQCGSTGSPIASRSRTRVASTQRSGRRRPSAGTAIEIR